MPKLCKHILPHSFRILFWVRAGAGSKRFLHVEDCKRESQTMIRRNLAQRFFVYCIDSSDGKLASGQAANITASFYTPADVLTATADVNPTEAGTTGYYFFNLTAGETNFNTVDIIPKHSNSKYVVLPLDGERWTSVDTNVTTVNGTNILVGDLNFAVSAGGQMVNDTLYIVPGDKYDADDDTAITFTDSRFPDLDLFSSAELTVYVAGVQVVDHISTLLLDEATKTISVELTEAQTNLLLDYVGEDATFDLELVRADSTRKTIARGPANVLDPL